MYVVLGASGHSGHVVAKTLLARGQKVRVVGRNAEHFRPLTAQGAELSVADATDAAALTNAFQGAHSAYVLIPSNPASNDVLAFQDRVGDAIAEAIGKADIQHVVALSSIGADKSSGTGPVVGLHNFEQKLNSVGSANVLFLRAGYFMENAMPQANVIRVLGSVAGPLRADLKISMIATRDIGTAAAEALLRREFRGKQTRELLGQRDLDYVEAAAIIGKGIGKPSLGYVQPPEQQLRTSMVQMGMSANMVDLLLEMAQALNSGYMKALEPRTQANSTPTSFETFVSDEFIPAYQKQMAA
jgi:uncharacterized protein YbjT (DUF2867 family)